MSLLYMIRHAQASFGQPDYDRLSDLGHNQARLLAEQLHRMGGAFDAIYSGCQLRHAQTLEAYASRCSKEGVSCPEAHRREALNEYDASRVLDRFIPDVIREEPALEAAAARMMSDRRTFQKLFEMALMRWIGAGGSAADCESWTEFSGRVVSGVEAIMAREGAGRRVAVFTSGGAIAATVQRALQLSDEVTLKLSWQIVNSSITRFKFCGDRLMLFGFNEFAHLESAGGLVTYR